MSNLDAPVFGRGIEGEENAEGFYRRMQLKLKDCGVELPQDATFLEVGSGSGAVLSFLKGKGLNIQGIDIEPQNAEIMKADAAALPYEDASFDCIMSKHVFDNIEHPTQSPEVEKTMLREIARVLKSGGIYYAVEMLFEKPPEDLLRLPDRSGDYSIAVYQKQ